jgi:hypothetical protein
MYIFYIQATQFFQCTHEKNKILKKCKKIKKCLNLLFELNFKREIKSETKNKLSRSKIFPYKV